MGGGAAMRAGAKVAGIGVLNGGLRGVPAMPAAEQSVRNAARPASAILSSSSAGSKTASSDVSAITAAWNDWDFADGVEELTMESGEPMPRAVFGGVPSFQEAKQATTELKDALDKVYLPSPKSTGFGHPFAADHVSDLSPLTSPELETKSRVISEATPTPVPNNVLQAFKLLSVSTEAQNVVASIASDQNVWNAMMDNLVLKDFLVSYQRNNEFPDLQSPMKFVESSGASQTVNTENGFADNMGRMQKIKLKVREMVSNVSNYCQNIFGFSAADGISSDANGNASSTFMDRNLGSYIMGLVVMIIMVVLLRRG